MSEPRFTRPGSCVREIPMTDDIFLFLFLFLFSANFIDKMKRKTNACKWLSTESELVTSQVNKYGDNLRDSRRILAYFSIDDSVLIMG